MSTRRASTVVTTVVRPALAFPAVRRPARASEPPSSPALGRAEAQVEADPATRRDRGVVLVYGALTLVLALFLGGVAAWVVIAA